MLSDPASRHLTRIVLPCDGNRAQADTWARRVCVQESNQLQTSGPTLELADLSLFRSVDRRVLDSLLVDCPVR